MGTAALRKLRRILKYYSRVIIKNIGIFIFAGVVEILFGISGWCPNGELYVISFLAADILIPVFLVYSAAELLSDHTGGVLAVLALTGILVNDTNIGIVGAFLLGPLCGLLWKHAFMEHIDRIKSGMELLVKNLAVVICGVIIAVVSYLWLAPILTGLMAILESGVTYLITHRFIVLLSVLIEPAKVLFLNNSINYGILIPLGMQQVKETGNSLLFLLESNPGPGLGVLLAVILMNVKKRKEYVLATLIHFVGGIHEMYFPVVYDHVGLALPLILGGMTGSWCFLLLDGGLSAPAAPGSIVIILLMAEKNHMLGVIMGVVLSTVVSFITSLLVLKIETKVIHKSRVKQAKEKQDQMANKKPIRNIGVICDGGMGSSAMGASLLRRRLEEHRLENITVTAYAVDLIPEGLDLLVCQKNFQPVLVEAVGRGQQIYVLESLTDMTGMNQLVDWIEGGQKG